ncbi:MAG: hypothetical protein KAX44_03230 [Candidatus Brocadiae bacterium]|nr:hypothetical protein [Candidatus Brocadiia bacterium]
MAVPMCLIIDDGAPLVNVYWWHAAAGQKTDAPVQKSGEPVVKDVAPDFIGDFVRVISRHGIRGKFSVLPYPAGLGKISEGWPGCDMRTLRSWVRTVRTKVMPVMDITPEVLTHAQALDLKTFALLDENERDWAAHQTEATLTPYVATALRFLNEAGLNATGFTFPWGLRREVEPDYQRAILAAMKEVNGQGQTWYFLHTNYEGNQFLSELVLREGEDWLVSIVSQCPDFLWQTMDTDDTSPEYVRSIADFYVTEDGQEGRLTELFVAGTPVVFHTHWQSMYSNRRRTGLRALEEVGRRVAALWGTQVRWVTCSELAADIADA